MIQRHKYKATPRFIALLVIVCFVFVSAVYLSQEKKLDEIAGKKAELDAQYTDLLAEEERLEYMIVYAQSDEYRLQYAREKLGLVLPQDIKFDIEQ